VGDYLRAGTSNDYRQVLFQVIVSYYADNGATVSTSEEEGEGI
jgi:hypothetical protein